MVDIGGERAATSQPGGFEGIGAIPAAARD
ncbi:MAG: hypothetical protein K0Q89_2989, partial [Thermomicrobiales bacterium]|nr:hypothetical protein [Thermomicrobiales bacterium]